MIQDLLYGKIRQFACAAAMLLAAGTPQAFAQGTFQLLPAEPITLPIAIDSNTASFWHGPSFRLFSSTGAPVLNTISAGFLSEDVQVNPREHFPMWIESVWDSGSGTLYAWYHHEQVDVCPGTSLTTPEIGALVSRDGGKSFTDLGIILKSGAPNDCSAQNGYFASGHGDFSVILDHEQSYFYFLIGSYGGDISQQGVAIARMSIDKRDDPVGAVWKYYAGEWSEPGIAGRVTPVFPAKVAWQAPNTDSFWGPSVHWNSYLGAYVVLMNRACCKPGWPQEGVYLTMTSDIGDPASWSAPVKILDPGDWYPWVIGAAPGETSSEAGQTVRFFVRNSSSFEIVFHRDGEEDSSDTTSQPAQAGETRPPRMSRSSRPPAPRR